MEEIDRLLHIVAHFYHSAAAVFYKVEHDGVYPLAVALAAARADHLRHILLAQNAGADRIVKIVVYVRNAVGQAHDGRLGRIVRRAVRMVQDAHARFIAQIEPSAVALKYINNAQRLLIVLEALFIYPVERALSRVAERRVPQVVAERRRLGEILVEVERSGYRACKARYLQRVREARSVMIALRQEVDLRFVLESAEGLGVSYPVNIALEAGAYLALGLRLYPALRVLGSDAVLADERPLEHFAFFPRTRHTVTSYQKRRQISLQYLYTTQIRISLYFYQKIFISARTQLRIR